MFVSDRKRLAEVFDGTMELCRMDRQLKKKVAMSIEGQKVILEGDSVFVPKEKFEEPAQIIVSKKRTLEAAQGYRGKQVCVHNFASSKHPGGGVTRGASAQEECICRISTLYPCLAAKEAMEKFYLPHRRFPNPIGNDDCIYSPGVVVVKTDANCPEELERKGWYEVNVVTCAAPNLREYKGRVTQKELKELHEKRVGRILDIAKANGNTAVILGAFGCGVFMNQPEVVADACAALVKRYRYDFEAIEFAVYCTPKDSRNYDVFKRRLMLFR